MPLISPISAFSLRLPTFKAVPPALKRQQSKHGNAFFTFRQQEHSAVRERFQLLERWDSNVFRWNNCFESDRRCGSDHLDKYLPRKQWTTTGIGEFDEIKFSSTIPEWGNTYKEYTVCGVLNDKFVELSFCMYPIMTKIGIEEIKTQTKPVFLVKQKNACSQFSNRPMNFFFLHLEKHIPTGDHHDDLRCFIQYLHLSAVGHWICEEYRSCWWMCSQCCRSRHRKRLRLCLVS